MTSPKYHLVYANLAQTRAELDDPTMKGFRKWLEDVDASAKRGDGFISQPALPDAGKVYHGDMVLNVSIWESVEKLERFVTNKRVSELLARREEWCIEDDEPTFVLYWILPEEKVTEKKIKERFELLEQSGPSPSAFTFERRFTVEAFLTSGLRAKPNTNMT